MPAFTYSASASQDSLDRSSKQKYEIPHVTVLGNVSQLTQSGKGPGGGGGPGPNQGPGGGGGVNGKGGHRGDGGHGSNSKL